MLDVASAGPGVLSSSTKEPMVVSSSSPTGMSREMRIRRGPVGLDDLLNGQIQLRRNLLQGRLTAQLLDQLAVAAGRLVDDLYHMHRHADRSGLVGQWPG